MADDKTKVDQRDRSRVAGDEDYEIGYMAEKLGVDREKVTDAIKAVGNDREAITQHIRGNK